MGKHGAHEENFWAKVDKHGPVPAHRPELGPCFIWKAATNKDGYGILNVANKHWKAHRFAWFLLWEQIPEGYTLDHLCRNTVCVNTDHMELVTNEENSHRAVLANGKLNPDCIANGHEFGRQGKNRRRCLTCSRKKMLEWYYRRKNENATAVDASAPAAD